MGALNELMSVTRLVVTNLKLKPMNWTDVGYSIRNESEAQIHKIMK